MPEQQALSYWVKPLDARSSRSSITCSLLETKSNVRKQQPLSVEGSNGRACMDSPTMCVTRYLKRLVTPGLSKPLLARPLTDGYRADSACISTLKTCSYPEEAWAFSDMHPFQAP